MRWLLLTILLGCPRLFADDNSSYNDIETYEWFTTSGVVKEVVSSNYFVLSNSDQQMLVKCHDHRVTVHDSIKVLGDKRGKKRARIFGHIIFKDDTIYHLNNLRRFDTLSLPPNFLSTPTNKYLYRYAKKLKADQKKTIAIGSLLGVTSISLLLSHSKKRNESPATAVSNTKTNSDNSSSTEKTDTSLVDNINNLFDSKLSSSVNPTSSYELTPERKTVLISTVIASGILTAVNGIIRRKQLAKIPTLEQQIQPKVSLSIQPGGTINEPGLFLVGTF